MTNPNFMPHPDGELNISGKVVQKNENKEKSMLFNEYFKLKEKEEKLDFVNIPLTTDLPLYIDPYAISIKPGEWYEECNDLVVDFFERVMLAIKNNDDLTAYRLLSKLGEPNETHLGVSSGIPDGCGIGKEQAKILLNKLKNSKAAQTGYLKDLSDCELMIEGIGADKISDITTNIIRGKLIEYTERQCLEHNIPYQDVVSHYYWSAEEAKWITRDAKLPFYNGNPILLVPKNIVVKTTISNYEKFYNIVMLPYYEDLHISMGSQLVRVLKNGKIKVNKQELRKLYKCSKARVNDFIEEKPEQLAKYKATRI